MRQPLGLYLLVLSLALSGTLISCGGTTVHAQNNPPARTLQGLAGAWQATLIGNTGCGLSSALVTFTLDSSGMATNATNTGHFTQGSPCQDGGTSTGNTFQILSLNSNGSGTANLSCGNGCGWNFQIQVNRDSTEFNLVDVDPQNPNNLLQGVAILQ